MRPATRSRVSVRRSSTLHAATGELLARMENRLLRGRPPARIMGTVMVVAATIVVGRHRVPIGGRRVVDRLGELVLVFGVLLAQRLVLGLQPFAVGGFVVHCLLACLLVALLRGIRVVRLALGLFLSSLLMGEQALLVERVEMMR